jgi:hypothetical protein
MIYKNEFVTRIVNLCSIPDPEGFRVLDRGYLTGNFYISLPIFHVSTVLSSRRLMGLMVLADCWNRIFPGYTNFLWQRSGVSAPHWAANDRVIRWSCQKHRLGLGVPTTSCD